VVVAPPLRHHDSAVLRLTNSKLLDKLKGPTLFVKVVPFLLFLAACKE
jgi:hypothetical protein